MRRYLILSSTVILSASAACRPSDVLDVPPPAGELASSAVQSAQTAQAVFYAARTQLSAALDGSSGLILWDGLLSDEFNWTSLRSFTPSADIDARLTRASVSENNAEPGDNSLQTVLNARSSLLIAEGDVQQYGGTAGQETVGEAFALVGYAELMLAESYCAGVTLSEAKRDGGWVYGMPLSTDTLLLAAQAHFDSALAHTTSQDSVQSLASIGLGRALLDLAKYDSAALAVASVATGFTYSLQLEPSQSTNVGPGPNMYASQMGNCGEANVSDREGGNGLNFVSAQDPRLVLDSTLQITCDGFRFFHEPDSVWYYPLKFRNPSSAIPLATGVEARLIAAEAAWHDGGPDWVTDLNALRADSADTHVVFSSVLPADSTTSATDSAQVDLLFRERAFWLFGTGTRLGDMRRLLRQYQRDQSTVYPVGPYATGLRAGIQTFYTTYGPDVNLTLPTTASGNYTTNPNYKGCLTDTKTA